MVAVVTGFAVSPDRGRGLARDMRVRWAMEELGVPYEARLLSLAALKEGPYLSRQPWGQIPTFEDGEVALFESGAIVLHLAQGYPGLLPEGRAARARAMSWIFAAVATVEPAVQEVETGRFFESADGWPPARLQAAEARLWGRLLPLEARMAGRDWLDEAFTAGDLMMIDVLRRVGGLGERCPSLAALVARGQARPAFGRAFAAQRAVWEAAAAGGRDDEGRAEGGSAAARARPSEREDRGKGH
jgi:glutathione S-transferase